MVCVNDLVCFTCNIFPHYTDEDKVKKIIDTHIMFNTLDYGIDEKGVTYMMRYNVKDDTCEVIDLAIREDLRGVGFLKAIIGRCWLKWSTLTKFKFQRPKYNRSRTYNISRFLNYGGR